MIQENIKKWHDHIKGDFPGGFDELLAVRNRFLIAGKVQNLNPNEFSTF